MSSVIHIEKNRNGQYIWVLQQEGKNGLETLAQSPGTFSSINDAKKAAESFKKLAPKAQVLGVKDDTNAS